MDPETSSLSRQDSIQDMKVPTSQVVTSSQDPVKHVEISASRVAKSMLLTSDSKAKQSEEPRKGQKNAKAIQDANAKRREQAERIANGKGMEEENRKKKRMNIWADAFLNYVPTSQVVISSQDPVQHAKLSASRVATSMPMTSDSQAKQSEQPRKRQKNAKATQDADAKRREHAERIANGKRMAEENRKKKRMNIWADALLNYDWSKHRQTVLPAAAEGARTRQSKRSTDH